MPLARVLVIFAVPALISVLTPAGLLAAAPPGPGKARFAEAVYGDFSLAGNTVMSCPPAPKPATGKASPQSCADALQRKGSGVPALNNSHAMDWVDIDADQNTFNSSSARVKIPAGADVAYAKLDWAGDVGSRSDVPCGRDKTAVPPGNPEKQAVSLAVNDGVGRPIGPDRFVYSADEPARLSQLDQQFYSAHADVTAEFRDVHGDATVTVGNVWTPRGFDCFGGWSITVVWKFPAPRVPEAPAKKSVVVHSGHVRVATATDRVAVTTGSLHAAGGTARFGITAFEGDWASAGDQFLVNGVAQGRENAGNFFDSGAEGRLKPDYPNSMGVDVATVEVSDEVVRPGATSAELVFTHSQDAYLVTGLVAAFPLPGLTAATRPDRPVAHPGDPITQTVEIANPGGAPARAVSVRVGPEPACVRDLGRLAAGENRTVTCPVTAAGDDYQTSVKVSGASLAGDALAAEATSSVEVLRPRLEVKQTADPGTVLQGQPVQVTTVVTNTGDTPLSGLALHNSTAGGCDRPALAGLAPAETLTVDCTVTAGREGAANTATVTGSDRLDRQVSGAADSAFSVVHPLLAISAVWSADRVRRGEQVTVTVRVDNPSAVPFTDVVVGGEPPSCRRELGTLEPGRRIVYTCAVVVDSGVASELEVTGTPVVGGRAYPDARARADSAGRAEVRIDLVPAVAIAPLAYPAAPPPPAPRVVPAASVLPVSKPAIGAIAAVIAMASMLIAVSASSLVRP